jgi:hypothetical protein
MSKRYEVIGNFTIFFDQMYYIAYPGGRRELTAKQEKEWVKANSLPDLAGVKEKNKLGLINNPNVVPIKGIDLLSFIKELGYVPFFDRAFNGKTGTNGTNMLQLSDVVVYESIKQKSYEIAMRGY